MQESKTSCIFFCLFFLIFPGKFCNIFLQRDTQCIILFWPKESFINSKNYYNDFRRIITDKCKYKSDSQS